MREFDINGLRLAEFQGKLFEKSTLYFEGSTLIFLRRFLHSEVKDILDENESSLISFSELEAFEYMDEEFGKTSYGKNKVSPNILFWIGYIYRYISYTRDMSTNLVVKFFPFKMMCDLYYSYHTQDNEWIIKSILEENNIKEEMLDKNYRMKEIIKKHRESL